MGNHERYSPDPIPGIPEITPDSIKAFQRQHRNSSDDLRQLAEDYPAFAQDLITGREGVDPEYIRLRHAFVAGALYTYFLLKRTAAAQPSQLEAQFNAPSTDGDVGDGDLPPSV